ncbi:efflux RND transporter periplasmic adaptor subunit [Paenibacillus chartarius]|uniref:Efflux RND transporter periplasmic adaptor subunit n=1 Tax=Paenibacillus chartarius TaxID=747481 RepID=A0ABV6DTJ8_9BACL
MKKAIWGVVIVVIVAVIALGFVLSGGEGQASNLETVTVEQGTIADTLYVNGKVESESETTAYTEMSGKITKLFVREGDTVAAGQVLLELDTTELQEQLAREETNLRIIEEERTKEIKQHFDEFKKSRFEQGTSANVKAEQPDGSLYELKKRNQQLTIESIRAKLLLAQVKAAAGGVITELQAAVGQTVTGGASVATIVDLQKLRIKANLNELDAGKVKAGMDTVISGDAFSQQFKGKVQSLAAIAQTPQTGTSKEPYVEMTVKPENATAELKPGFTAAIAVTLPATPRPIVPHAAVLSEAGSSYVFVVKDGVLAKTAVTTGSENESMIAIESGVSAGDRIVAQASDKLQDKAKVNVQ